MKEWREKKETRKSKGERKEGKKEWEKNGMGESTEEKEGG